MSIYPPSNEDQISSQIPWDCWLLHLYTAFGAVLGIQAILATNRGDAVLAFKLMMLAIFIDATDGTLARKIKVKERLDKIDGATLDNIIDYLTYVIVPIYVMTEFGLIWNHWLCWAPIALASALGFSNVGAKSDDDLFLGFPSYWNLVAIYLFHFAWPVWINCLIVLALAVMVFAPIHFIYPSKTKPFQALTLSLGAVWALQTIALVFIPETLPEWWLMSSLFYPVYYLSASLYLERRRRVRA